MCARMYVSVRVCVCAHARVSASAYVLVCGHVLVARELVGIRWKGAS